jgi:hypothetical protein
LTVIAVISLIVLPAVLSDDLIIGVIVGAALIVIANQIVKLWAGTAIELSTTRNRGAHDHPTLKDQGAQVPAVRATNGSAFPRPLRALSAPKSVKEDSY